MENCIFCKIANGEIPSNTVYEDEVLRVFMDLNPKNNGHMLVVPKKHITDFTELDNETAVHINETIKKLKGLIEEKLNPAGIRFGNNYGIYQEVKHYHLHIIPGYEPEQPIVDVALTFDKLTK